MTNSITHETRREAHDAKGDAACAGAGSDGRGQLYRGRGDRPHDGARVSTLSRPEQRSAEADGAYAAWKGHGVRQAQIRQDGENRLSV